MKRRLERFVRGTEFIINHTNAHEWVPIIGEPIAKALQKVDETTEKKFTIVKVCTKTKSIIISPSK